MRRRGLEREQPHDGDRPPRRRGARSRRSRRRTCRPPCRRTATPRLRAAHRRQRHLERRVRSSRPRALPTPRPTTGDPQRPSSAPTLRRARRRAERQLGQRPAAVHQPAGTPIEQDQQCRARGTGEQRPGRPPPAPLAVSGADTRRARARPPRTTNARPRAAPAAPGRGRARRSVCSMRRVGERERWGAPSGCGRHGRRRDRPIQRRRQTAEHEHVRPTTLSAAAKGRQGPVGEEATPLADGRRPRMIGVERTVAIGSVARGSSCCPVDG